MAQNDGVNLDELSENIERAAAQSSTNQGGTTVGATGAGGAQPGKVMGGTIGPGTQPEDTVDANLEDMEVNPADPGGTTAPSGDSS